MIDSKKLLILVVFASICMSAQLFSLIEEADVACDSEFVTHHGAVVKKTGHALKSPRGVYYARYKHQTNANQTVLGSVRFRPKRIGQGEGCVVRVRECVLDSDEDPCIVAESSDFPYHEEILVQAKDTVKLEKREQSYFPKSDRTYIHERTFQDLEIGDIVQLKEGWHDCTYELLASKKEKGFLVLTFQRYYYFDETLLGAALSEAFDMFSPHGVLLFQAGAFFALKYLVPRGKLKKR